MPSDSQLNVIQTPLNLIHQNKTLLNVRSQQSQESFKYNQMIVERESARVWSGLEFEVVLTEDLHLPIYFSSLSCSKITYILSEQLKMSMASSSSSPSALAFSSEHSYNRESTLTRTMKHFLRENQLAHL
ncbi:unnamed protein product [Lactuca saligna]|uniref:Uncharacterized protein n=1 Tax=Lactuca saligna TaxID=75948 RepID=A0AA35ZQI4_LACSI|nr:unnamed protein product [Lactuca saligna]